MTNVLSTKLTPGQQHELGCLLVGPQPTYGKGRARIQNELVRCGLARFASIPDGGDFCVITEAGRAFLADAPPGTAWKFAGRDCFVLQREDGSPTGWVVRKKDAHWYAFDGTRPLRLGKRVRVFATSDKARRAVRLHLESLESLESTGGTS